MPHYRRYLVPGATFFLTVVTHDRRPFLATPPYRSILKEAFTACQKRFPFDMPAVVLLPDHFHVLWALPHGDDRYPARIGFIKKEFTKAFLAAGGFEGKVTQNQLKNGRRGVWQPRYWEHLIKDEADYENHFHYIHYNPVKHGYVERAADWQYSSFHRWVREGVYTVNWGCGPGLMKVFEKIAQKAGE